MVLIVLFACIASSRDPVSMFASHLSGIRSSSLREVCAGAANVSIRPIMFVGAQALPHLAHRHSQNALEVHGMARGEPRSWFTIAGRTSFETPL